MLITRKVIIQFHPEHFTKKDLGSLEISKDTPLPEGPIEVTARYEKNTQKYWFDFYPLGIKYLNGKGTGVRGGNGKYFTVIMEKADD